MIVAADGVDAFNVEVVLAATAVDPNATNPMSSKPTPAHAYDHSIFIWILLTSSE
jgi:hypothetical protein